MKKTDLKEILTAFFCTFMLGLGLIVATVSVQSMMESCQ